MHPLFHVRKIVMQPESVPAYWIESTAPLNVDDPLAQQDVDPQNPASTNPTHVQLPTSPPSMAEVHEVTTADPLDEMADLLVKAHHSGNNPEIVITIHGFNNPVEVVEQRYAAAYSYVNSDEDIRRHKGLVCIGYRWPSEAMGAPRKNFATAMPGVLITLLVASTVLALLSIGTGAFRHHIPWLLKPLHALTYVTALLVFSVPLAAFLLRVVVYFRDIYRATHYGVPDLVEFIRRLDQAVHKRLGSSSTYCVKLSFIGHSMGGFVVTNLVRILSDVFDTNSIGSRDGRNKDPGPNIGRVFILSRLLLISPDIPAEALMMRRANFLASSLRRFEEAYLFSNEGDEVLRLISTLANYFSFPTTRRSHGFRLGNVEVLGDDPNAAPPAYGVVNLAEMQSWSQQWQLCRSDDERDTLVNEQLRYFMRHLRVGSLNFEALHKSIPQLINEDSTPLPLHFTYFDCTDYFDHTVTTASGCRQGAHGVLTYSLQKPKLSVANNWKLLFQYLFKQRNKVDVHSGYFDGLFMQQLIYRLACLGFDQVLPASNPPAPSRSFTELSEVCKQHRIQVLLSPKRMQHTYGLKEAISNT